MDAPGPSTTGDVVVLGVGITAATAVVVAIGLGVPAAASTTAVAVQVLMVLAIGAGALALARRPGRSDQSDQSDQSDRSGRSGAGFLVAWCTALFLGAGAIVLLHGSPFAPIGYILDQGYRTAYLTKFAHTWRLVDYAYRDLPSFYPPLFFWVLGRAAALSGIAAWKMLKVGTILVAFAVPLAGWLGWRPLVGPRRAAVVVVVTSLAFQEWYVPHLWLAIVLFVPWWCHFVLGVGRTGRLRRGQLLTAIALGTVIAGTYWYVLVVGVVQLLLALALRRTARRHGVDPGPRSWRDVGWIAGGTAVLTAVYWVPMVVGFLTTPGARTMQNRYYTAGEVPFPLPFLDFSARGAVFAVGLLSLVVLVARPLVRALLGLLIAAYVWYALGYLGVLAGVPLDTLRITGVIEFVLAAGAALGAVAAWRAMRRTVADGGRAAWSGLRPPATAPFALAVVAVASVVAIGQTAVLGMPFLEEQREARPPTGIVRGFARATEGRFEDSVVFTDSNDLPAFLPVYVFNTTSAHYANPLAEFDDRARFVTALSRDGDPETFAIAFLHNRFDRIDYVALNGQESPYNYFWSADAFPDGVRVRKVRFTDSQFGSDAFVPLDDPAQSLYRVRRAGDPVRDLRRCPAEPDRAGCDALGDALSRYRSFLDPPTLRLAQRWRRSAHAG